MSAASVVRLALSRARFTPRVPGLSPPFRLRVESRPTLFDQAAGFRRVRPPRVDRSRDAYAPRRIRSLQRRARALKEQRRQRAREVFGERFTYINTNVEARRAGLYDAALNERSILFPLLVKHTFTLNPRGYPGFLAPARMRRKGIAARRLAAKQRQSPLFRQFIAEHTLRKQRRGLPIAPGRPLLDNLPVLRSPTPLETIGDRRVSPAVAPAPAPGLPGGRTRPAALPGPTASPRPGTRPTAGLTGATLTRLTRMGIAGAAMARRDVQAECEAAASEYERQLKAILSGSDTRPRTPPAMDTGELRDSIEVSCRVNHDRSVTFIVMMAGHGIPLDRGDFPFLIPALQRTERVLGSLPVRTILATDGRRTEPVEPR